MKIGKRILICVAALLGIAVLTALSVPLINNLRAYKLKQQLLHIPLPAQSEIVESVSAAGKLTGNGNGMQYFAAVLLRSDLPLDALRAHYDAYTENGGNGPFVARQSGQRIEGVRGAVRFLSAVDGQDYYTVYLWGYNSSAFLALDLRGH